jgi:hypothetical protein
MKPICALVVTALVSLGGCQQGADSQSDSGWQDFAPEGKGFSVLMPGTPTEETSSEATVFGMMDTSLFEVQPEGDKLTYTIRYDNYPPGIRAIGNVPQLVYARQKRLEYDVQGKELSAGDISLGEHPGRQVSLELPDGSIGIYRIFLVEHRMYQVGVQAPEEETSAEEISKFLDSFQLL